MPVPAAAVAGYAGRCSATNRRPARHLGRVRQARFATADGGASSPAAGRAARPARRALQPRRLAARPSGHGGPVDTLRAERVHRYLPLGIGASTRHYLVTPLRGARPASALAGTRRGAGLSHRPRRAQAVPDRGPLRAGRLRCRGSRWPLFSGVRRLRIDGNRLTLEDTAAKTGQTGSGRPSSRASRAASPTSCTTRC